MFIDFKSVADCSFILFDEFKFFSGWCSEMYERNYYMFFLDIYRIDKFQMQFFWCKDNMRKDFRNWSFTGMYSDCTVFFDKRLKSSLF